MPLADHRVAGTIHIVSQGKTWCGVLSADLRRGEFWHESSSYRIDEANCSVCNAVKERRKR